MSWGLVSTPDEQWEITLNGPNRKARKEASREIDEAYTGHLNRIIGELDHNPRNLYRVIKSRKTEVSTVPSLSADEGPILSDSDKANRLNEYFASVFTNENLDAIPSISESKFEMPPIDVSSDGVLKLLLNLDIKKSTGPAGLTSRVLKETAYQICKVLSFIFSQSLSAGVVPDDWRDANIFALHKKGPKDRVKNYRPISLTSVCSKIIEHIVYSSIARFLAEHNTLSPRQHGFRKGHSCETQLILSIDDWA